MKTRKPRPTPTAWAVYGLHPSDVSLHHFEVQARDHCKRWREFAPEDKPRVVQLVAVKAKRKERK